MAQDHQPRNGGVRVLRKKLLPRSPWTHKKYFCGPDAVRTAKLAKREKKRDVANEKAMRTLKIKSGKAEDVVDALPTPSNFTAS